MSCHTCTSFTHPHISSTLPYTRGEVLFLPRLTFLSVIHPAICYLCVWPWTARPWNSEPVLVTSTPAWYCLRLCSASDIPVVARWPLPVWFCLCIINLTSSGSTRLRPVITHAIWTSLNADLNCFVEPLLLGIWTGVPRLLSTSPYSVSYRTNLLSMKTHRYEAGYAWC